MRRRRSAAAAAALAMVLLTGSCDGRDELHDLERGTDTRPAIEESPPAESR